jgi:hypothetical protein
LFDLLFNRIENTTGGMKLIRVHDTTGSDKEHGYILNKIEKEGSIHNINYLNDDDDDSYFIDFYINLQLSSPERTKKIKRYYIFQDDSKQHEIDQKKLKIVIIGVGQLDSNWKRKNNKAQLQNHINR